MAWDSIWEDVFTKQEWGKYPGEDLIRFIARNFYKAQNRKEIKILEVGCGTGANLWYIAREGFSVYGVDGSETAIHIARQRLEAEIIHFDAEESGKRLIIGDIAHLPFEDNFFDAVIDIEAVCCNSYDTSKSIYSEMYRVCKKGGKLFSRAFAKGCYGDEMGELVGHNAYLASEGPLAGKGYVRFTDECELKDLFGNMKLLEVEMLSRTMGGIHSNKIVKEWLITAEK